MDTGKAKIRPHWEANFDDFVLGFSMLNTIELSDLDNPESITVNQTRIEFALDLAANDINSWVSQAPPAGQITLRQQQKRLMLDIARYFLDSDKNRTYTKERYDAAQEFGMKMIELKRTTPYDADLAKIYGIKPNRTNRVRMGSDPRIPVLNRTGTTQVYREGYLYESSNGSRQLRDATEDFDR